MSDLVRWNDYQAALGRPGSSVVCIDLSGSMLNEARYGAGETKIAAALRAAAELDGQTVGFGSSVFLDLAAHELGRDVPLDCLVEGEGTPMRGALDHVRGMGPNVVTLVGDGAPTDASPQEVFEAAIRLGVPVNTIFVGGVPSSLDSLLGDGRDLMVAIANATGGYFLEVGVDATSNFSSLYEELSEGLSETLALPSKTSR